MKRKLLIILLVLATIFCFALAFTACGGATVDGTYYLYENGALNKNKYIKLDGGKWSDENGDSGDYKLDGTKITIYADFFGEKIEYTSGTVSDGDLFLKLGGANVHYYKEGSEPTENGGNNSGSGNQPAAQHTVTYDANGGTFSDGSSVFTQEVNSGSKLTAPTSPTRSNHAFAGWVTNKSGSTMWKFDENTISANITLYAQWTQESAVVLSVDGASIDGINIFMLVDHSTDSVSLANKVVCSDDSVWRLYYDRMGQTEIPTKIAAGLSGVLTNGDNVFYIVVTSQNGAQVNVYELTVHRSYQVTVSYYDSDALLETETTYTGESFTASYSPNIIGYIFNGWKDKNGKAFTSDVLCEVTHLYADKTARTYTATLIVNGGNELTDAEKTVTYNMSYFLPRPTRTGYTFTGWYIGSTQLTNANGLSLADWTYTSNQTVTAHWEANNYTVTLKQNDTSAGTVSGAGEYAYDINVTITATTNNGYTFLGWYQDDEKVSSELSYKFKMGMAVTYTARWILCPVTLVKDVSAGGTVSGVEKTIAGTQTTITAKTSNGYTWLGWYNEDDEITREFTYTFTMPSSAEDTITYTAKWIECPVTIVSSDTSIGTVSGLPSTTVIGQKITVSASSSIRLGCEWLGWYNGEEKLTEEFAYAFDLSAETINFTAKYQVKSEMENFTFTSSTANCTITGVIDKTVTGIIVPDYVTSIVQGAFKDCNQLISIQLPFVGGNNSSTQSSESTVFGYIFGYRTVDDTVETISGSSYDAGSQYVKTATIISGTTRQLSKKLNDVTLRKYYNGSYSGTSTGTIYRHYDYYIPTTLREVVIRGGEVLKYTFYGCENLTNIEIPLNLTTYADYSFYGCKALTVIPESESATHIGYYAFGSCTGITTLHIPEGITEIDACAFRGCSGIVDVYVPSSLSYFGRFAFSDCTKLTNVHIEDLIAWCHIESHGNDFNSLMRGHYLYLNGKLVEYLEIPDEVIVITEDAFVGCLSLKSVKINLETIAMYAFDDCKNIEKLIIGKDVKNIGSFAFSRCSSLAEIFYEGTEAMWNEIELNISVNSNEYFSKATKYFYSEATPSEKQWNESSNWWHYGDNDEILIWTKED